MINSKLAKANDKSLKSSYEEELYEQESSQLAQLDKKGFISSRNKGVLITALNSIKDFHSRPETRPRPKSTANPHSAQFSKSEQFKKTQQENYSKILNSEELRVREALSQSFNSTRASARSQRPRKLSLAASKPLSLPFELDVGEKLARFDEKLEKSRIIHEKHLLMKVESARTQSINRRIETSDEDRGNELIIKLIERSRGVSERREERKKEVQEKWEKVKEFKEQRAKRMLEIETEFRKSILDKELDLQRKLRAADSLVKKRKNSLGKDFEIRNELKRLRDEEALAKLRRAHMIMEKNRENIIKKQVNDSYKLEVMKASKEIANGRQRDQAIQEMIEKERVKEVVLIIKKSPQSKAVADLLNKFNLMPKKKLEEEEIN